jgi:hypothetical protein
VTSDPESSDKSSDRSDDNSISDKVHNAIISANSDRDSDEVSDLTGVHNLFWSHEVIIKSLDWMDECPAKPDDNESNTPIWKLKGTISAAPTRHALEILVLILTWNLKADQLRPVTSWSGFLFLNSIHISNPRLVIGALLSPNFI